MVLEDIFIKIACNSDVKTVIICDRGVMDGSAYTFFDKCIKLKKM